MYTLTLFLNYFRLVIPDSNSSDSESVDELGRLPYGGAGLLPPARLLADQADWASPVPARLAQPQTDEHGPKGANK